MQKQDQSSKPSYSTLTWRYVLRRYILPVHNLRQLLFTSLILAWTRRVCTWLNSSSSWLKQFNFGYVQLHHLLQSNWTTMKWHICAWRLKLEERHRIPQRISTGNSAVLQLCLRKYSAKGTPLFPLQFRIKMILLQGTVATVVPKTLGRSLKDMQRGMQEMSFLLWHKILLM